MEYAIVSVPAAPVRRKPAHRKEMVSQLLFGESVKVLKKKDELWVRIRSLHDNYEGWITNTMLQPVEEEIAIATSAFATTEMLGIISLGEKQLYIPVGSSLPFFENGKGRLGHLEYNFNGQFCKRNEQHPGDELVKQLTSPWLNVPYMWGGRSPLGVDCSGFVQVIFKLMGIDLPRDAWQQAQEGKAVKKFAHSNPGDLAFFDNKEDIVHVGILLGNGEIIHSSGKVRLDQVDKKGIISDQPRSGKIRLRAIRRYW